MTQTKRRSPGGSKKKIVPGPFGGELKLQEHIKFPEKMSQAIIEQIGPGETGDDLIRRYVTEGLLRDREASTPSTGRIGFDLEEPDFTDFGKLTSDLYYDDPNFCAKIIARRSISYGPSVMQDFVSGKLEVVSKSDEEREIDAAVEAEMSRRAAKRPQSSNATKKEKAA